MTLPYTPSLEPAFLDRVVDLFTRRLHPEAK